MRTDDLIDALATEAPAAPAGAVMRRIGLAAGMGGLSALAVLIVWLGPRPDLHLAMRGVFFWVKLAYAASFAVSGAALVDSYGRPGGRGRWRWALVFAPVVALAALALTGDMGQPPARLHADWMGHSWNLCPWRILALAVPSFLAALWAFRRMAPTRLTLAGFAAGLLAGGVSAAIYCIACDEASALFVVTWYTAGIFACGVLGALLGPRLLRW